MTFHDAAYRIYSRWVREGDRSSKSVYDAIQEAYQRGRVDGIVHVTEQISAGRQPHQGVAR